jgi:hypothetical protein
MAIHVETFKLRFGDDLNVGAACACNCISPKPIPNTRATMDDAFAVRAKQATLGAFSKARACNAEGA